MQGFLLLSWPWRTDLFHSVLSLFFPASSYHFGAARTISDVPSAGSLLLQMVARSKALCRVWAQTPSKCYSKPLIWFLVPDIHSFIKKKTQQTTNAALFLLFKPAANNEEDDVIPWMWQRTNIICSKNNESTISIPLRSNHSAVLKVDCSFLCTELVVY